MYKKDIDKNIQINLHRAVYLLYAEFDKLDNRKCVECAVHLPLQYALQGVKDIINILEKSYGRDTYDSKVVYNKDISLSVLLLVISEDIQDIILHFYQSSFLENREMKEILWLVLRDIDSSIFARHQEIEEAVQKQAEAIPKNRVLH